jgi:predicted Zn finger-like uncharacterized protein
MGNPSENTRSDDSSGAQDGAKDSGEGGSEKGKPEGAVEVTADGPAAGDSAAGQNPVNERVSAVSTETAISPADRLPPDIVGDLANAEIQGRQEDLLEDLVAGYSGEDADLNPQTCCSNCRTVFEVSLELLSSSDTRVRCGECLSIFDALANLRDNDTVAGGLLVDRYGKVIEPGAVAGGSSASRGATSDYDGGSGQANASVATLAGLATDSSSLDVTYSDLDLFSADADLPEVSYFDQTRETPHFDFDDLAEDENDETFSDTLFAQDVTVDARSALRNANEADDSYDLRNIALDSDVDYITDDKPREALIFNYQERETRIAGQLPSAAPPARGRSAGTDGSARPVSSVNIDDDVTALDELDPRIAVIEKPVGSWWFRSVLFLLVLILAAALYGYRERATLQHNRYLRPLLVSACSVLKCTLADQVDLASMRILKRSVFSHPNLDNVLIINIGFVNEAAFSQRYPVLEIRLTDRNGRLVVKNDFEPADYLDSWQEGDVFDVGKRLDISLNVEDPGRTAMSFELDFR